MESIKAIDSMCRVTYCLPAEAVKDLFQVYEFKIMAITTFGGVMKKIGAQPGEEWKVLGTMSKGSLEAFIKEVDEQNVQYTFMDQLLAWSRREHKTWGGVSIEKLNELQVQSGGRIVGGAGYNPFFIKESLDLIEEAVTKYNFKYVWAHPISFGIAPNDKKMYPLYQKCIELNIPCCMQVGQSAEPLTSEPGHPMYADEAALDFPQCTFVLTHTGWPWIDEWMSMVWKHANVYGNIGAYMPSSLDPSLVQFFDGARGQNKTMWATNGFGTTRSLAEFNALPIKDATKQKVLRDNALKVFKLNP